MQALSTRLFWGRRLRRCRRFLSSDKRPKLRPICLHSLHLRGSLGTLFFIDGKADSPTLFATRDTSG
jgi:hypothetical protein